MAHTVPDNFSPPTTGHVFVRAALAMLLLWIAFPPVGLSMFGWIAVMPLVSLAADKGVLKRADYWKIWFAGLLFWLVTLYFIPIPHPALWLGWIALSMYLACYFPFFVLSGRTMIGRFHIPVFVAIPVAWVGLELIRAHVFTGFGLVFLSHTQYQNPLLIQIGDLSGAYTLSFAMTMFAAAAHQFFFGKTNSRRPSWSQLVPAAAAVAVVIGYGQFKLNQQSADEDNRLVVALIQGSIDTVLTADKEQAEAIHRKKTEQYQRLTREALQTWNDIQLVIWPENGWPYPDLLPETDKTKMPPEDVRAFEDATFFSWTRLLVQRGDPPCFLVGAASIDPVAEKAFGSALFFNREGDVDHRYFKNHLVPFGEYVPLADWIPLLQRVPAIGKGLNAGTEPVSVDVDGWKIAPSICFETTVPHYIRNQVQQLASQGEEPDILVNVTNDGWFYGTSCLDFHLACNVFRAVEMRKPMLVCANTGFSASIDQNGRIHERGPRRDTAILRTGVSSRPSFSPYRTIGDGIPVGFAFGTIACGLIGLIFRRSSSEQNGLNDLAGKLPDDPDGG